MVIWTFGGNQMIAVKHGLDSSHGLVAVRLRVRHGVQSTEWGEDRRMQKRRR